MTTPVFVDTSAWYSLAYRADVHHAEAVDFRATTSAPLVTSNMVFAETMSLLTKRHGKRAAIQFGGFLRDSRTLRIIRIEHAMEEAAWAVFRDYGDKAWDLVDCTSFCLMASLGLTTAFTFDGHFAQRGFEVVPA